MGRLLEVNGGPHANFSITSGGLAVDHGRVWWCSNIGGVQRKWPRVNHPQLIYIY